jgi:hypothetical protein
LLINCYTDIINSFTLERCVANWDTEYLEGQIRSLVAATRYKGDLEITFPQLFSRVIVNPSGPPNKWLSWLPKTLTAPDQREFPTTEPVKVIWPYANSPPGTTGRVCATMTEQEWWMAWKVPLRNAVLTKRQGAVTEADWVDAAMGLKVPDPWKNWGPKE